MVSDLSCRGEVGVLIVGTRGERGPGEVLVKIRGGSETFIAWSEDPLPKDTPVLIIEDRGGRTVDVVKWDTLSSDSLEELT